MLDYRHTHSPKLLKYMLASLLGSASGSHYPCMPWDEDDMHEWPPLSLPWGFVLSTYPMCYWLPCCPIPCISSTQALACGKCGCNQSSLSRCAKASTRVLKTYIRIFNFVRFSVSRYSEVAASWTCILRYFSLKGRIHILQCSVFSEGWFELRVPFLGVKWWWQNSKITRLYIIIKTYGCPLTHSFIKQLL